MEVVLSEFKVQPVACRDDCRMQVEELMLTAARLFVGAEFSGCSGAQTLYTLEVACQAEVIVLGSVGVFAFHPISSFELTWQVKSSHRLSIYFLESWSKFRHRSIHGIVVLIKNETVKRGTLFEHRDMNCHHAQEHSDDDTAKLEI